MKFYVRKWCKISSDVGIRSIVDWSYYKQRLSSAIQKIITIPAAMQKVANPVPRVMHPDWLHKKVREKEDKLRQRKLIDIFGSSKREESIRSNTDANATNNVVDQEKDKDMEDLGNKGRPVVGARPIIHNYEVTNGQDSVQKAHSHDQFNQDENRNPQNAISVQEVDKKVDYYGWLEIKKRKWKDAREKRKRQRLSNEKTSKKPSDISEFSGSLINHAQPQKTGVGSYFRRRELGLTRCHWEIIQMVPGTQPGQFFAWVVAEGVMFKIPITVPRVFYLNSKAPVTEEFPGRRVNKILPHGRRSHNLIEVMISEEQFRAENKKIAAHLADPEVEGIYEMKVPLEFNAVLHVGCVCKVEKTARRRNALDGWNLNELQMKTTTECHYLEHSISFFYLYHSISEGRAVYVGYFPTSKMITVVVVNPYQNKELSPSIVEKQYREACQALSIEPPISGSSITCKVEYVGQVKEAEKIMQRTISDHRHQNHGPTVAVIECPNVLLIKLGIPALDDVPCVNIPANARDSQYQAIGWQIVAAKIAIQRCAASSQWLHERVSLSRYAHVPLGNFELDWLVYTADIFFSRALRDQQQLLWISDAGVPDLGGFSDEDTCFADEGGRWGRGIGGSLNHGLPLKSPFLSMNPLKADTFRDICVMKAARLPFLMFVHQPVLVYPGAYRKVSVELKIHHLAVDALLKSSHINEIEGSAFFGWDQDSNLGADMLSEQYSCDEAASSAPAFSVLKQLVQRCLQDAIKYGNAFADAILQHLYRWLCSPQSKLHDPALHRMLHKVMQKVFALLLAEFRNLGATIIFANFSKVIIDTGKLDLSAAEAYCNSLLKTIQKRDLFEWIEIEPLHFWLSLLFMDQNNYGGIQARNNGSLTTISVPMAGGLHEKPQVDIVSSWNIAEQLPKAIQDHFILIISEFIYMPWNYAQEQAEIRVTIGDGELCTPSITAAVAQKVESHLTEYLKNLISSYFTDKLFRIVQDIIHLSKGMKKSENEWRLSQFNSVLADNVHKGDAALEFIKHVCAVFALDQNVLHDALVMRKNLLKILRVPEFAPEAEFFVPCSSFTLPDIICSYCNDCRDLDLASDSALLTQEWRCAVPQCGQPYDREMMENAFLQIARQRERLYHLQDLVCSKCKMVKDSHLAEQCVCGGSFKCKEEASEFLRKMRVLYNIAVQQNFQLFKECVSWILEIR
ncbi:hypothetical protein Ancab_014659 [Ancistrocladus abbreviatus]